MKNHFIGHPKLKRASQTMFHIEEAIEISAPLFNEPMYATSDASLIACAFSLYQVGADNKIIYLGMSSKLFSKSEQALSSFAREVLSITYGLTSFDYYLKFSVIK